MSRAAKLTFLGSCVFAAGTIWFVHRAQKMERETMYQGVLRDQERKAQREQNTREFEETRARYAELIKQQPELSEAGGNQESKGPGRPDK
ncbi:hypothetical protein H4R20_000845 [Coemansia guatemalensis]|uniref:Cytochrome c oxidase assembly protein n=2 Tax=Coemansia guatemalensis TaxID=2761395 RepID=A0A9W8LW85_9FUNG|nr:hypothetical protein H4R20_000845 [Coemansia guatemalensis]